jgi:hypothetical protein
MNDKKHKHCEKCNVEVTHKNWSRHLETKGI